MDQNADIFPRLPPRGPVRRRPAPHLRRPDRAAGTSPHGGRTGAPRDICWYDGVTDQHYENGHFYKLTPPPPTINMIDLTDYHEKEE